MKVLISVTGISTPSYCSARQRGFTLLEILVVVLIVVITVSAVITSTGFGRSEADFKLLGNNLGKLIHLLAQEAVFENRDYAISLNQQGYQILEYRAGRWAVSEQDFVRQITLSENQESRLLVDNLVVSAVAPDRLIPHILILSSGEMSSFEWKIIDTRLRAEIIVQGDLLANVTVLGPIYLSID